MAKLIFLDTETTGIDPQKNGIIQLAAIMDIEGQEVDQFNMIMKPFEGCIIEDEALEVSGITREQIEKAEPEIFVYRMFTAWLAKHIDKYSKLDKGFLVGYNANFDDQFLRALATRCNDKFLGSFKWPDIIDVRGIAALRLADKRPQMPNFKLGSVGKEILGETRLNEILESGGLHNALTDIVLTREIFYRVK